jgi:ribosomal 50S subunit-recycling heat shock protein
MRLDKFLKVSRILKRRTVANEACQGGKVTVNGKSAKPGAQIKAGDTVSVGFASGKLVFVVLDTRENVKKDDAATMYRIIESETENG